MKRFIGRLVPCLGLASALAVAIASPAGSGEVEIVKVEAQRSGATWRFDVTLSHADEGWEHYANAWFIETENGTEIARRVLTHPHVNEQPFTRSLVGIEIPTGVTKVFVRAQDSRHGRSDKRTAVDLSQ